VSVVVGRVAVVDVMVAEEENKGSTTQDEDRKQGSSFSYSFPILYSLSIPKESENYKIKIEDTDRWLSVLDY
jgi:hypothetical protein